MSTTADTTGDSRTAYQQDTPVEYRLSESDLGQLTRLVEELRGRSPHPAEAAFYDDAWRLQGKLPAGLLRFLDGFRRCERSATVLVKSFPVDSDTVGPTPRHWREDASGSSTTPQEMYLGLVGMALGEPFTWSTLQDGRMIQNVLPIHGEELAQSGHSSNALLEWHTEDGFHPYRCDYLMLFGIRNPDKVPTTLASVRDVELSAEHLAVLSEERFKILPDNEHLQQLAGNQTRHPGLRRMQELRDNPPAVSVLFGDVESPYLRIDPYFMRCASDTDHLAAEALAALTRELEKHQQEVVIDAGTLCIVDNYRAVHGRRPFVARYDGMDRWLKKLIVTRDLRKSRDQRLTVTDRVLY